MKDRRALGLWDYMKSLSEPEWAEHMGYVYRAEPSSGSGPNVAFGRVAGAPSYIGKFGGAIDEEYLRSTYGGRILQVKLKGPGDEMIFNQTVRIEAPPILQDVELPKAVTAAAAAAGAAPSSELIALVHRLITSRDEALSKGQPFDLNQHFQVALDLQRRGLEAGIDKRQSSPMDAVMEKLMLRLVDKLDAPPAAAADPLAQLNSTLALLDALRDRFGDGGGAATTPMIQLGAALLEKAPLLLDKLAVVTGNLAAAQRGRGPAVTLQTAALPEAPPAAEPAGGVDPLVQAVQDRGHKELLLHMLFAGDSGDDAALVLDKTAPLFAVSLAQQLAAGDLAALAADPILSQAAQHPGWVKFAQDFVEYFGEITPQEAAPATAPN